MKLDVVDTYVKEYINEKIREKYGENYSLDVADETMNISWDIKVESIKHHKTETWWNKEKPKLPKLKTKKNEKINNGAKVTMPQLKRV